MSDEPTREDARARWRAERTTFQRVYDIVTGLNDFVTAKEVGTRADCSTDGARTALTQLVEMGIAERRGERPVEYRRNESYLRWKRIESLARDHSPAELREELDALLAEDQSLQERFDTSSPDAVSPSVFESDASTPPAPMPSPRACSSRKTTKRSTSGGTRCPGGGACAQTSRSSNGRSIVPRATLTGEPTPRCRHSDADA